MFLCAKTPASVSKILLVYRDLVGSSEFKFVSFLIRLKTIFYTEALFPAYEITFLYPPPLFEVYNINCIKISVWLSQLFSAGLKFEYRMPMVRDDRIWSPVTSGGS